MLYFLHLPKTAGTSLLAYIGGSVPPGRVFRIYDPITAANRDTYKDRIGSDTLFYGHFSFGFHSLWNDERARYMTVLRHPVERVVSFYRHCSAHQDHPMHAQITERGLSLADFVEARLTGETNNLVVRTLAASYRPASILQDRICNVLSHAFTHRPVRPCPAGKLRVANDNLDRYFIHVGHIDCLQETAELIVSEAGCPLPSTQVGFENITDGRPIQIDSRTRRIIESENELDLELYHRLR